jgi:hypothetical protein
MPRDWVYRRGDSEFGPYEPSELKQLAADGTLWPTDQVSRVGLGKWVAAANVSGLFGDAVKPPAPAAAQPQRPVQVVKEKSAVAISTPPPRDIPLAREQGVFAGFHELTNLVDRKKLIMITGLIAGLIAAYAGFQFFWDEYRPVAVKSAPDGETWNDFVDATFFRHYVHCLDTNSPYLLNFAKKKFAENDDPIHALAISYHELENTNSVEHPIQGVLKGKYNIFPEACSGEPQAAGHVDEYQQYDVELKFFPHRTDEGFEKSTEWRLKTASMTKTMVGGRAISPATEELSVQNSDCMLEDDRFPALCQLFNRLPLGGYWPVGETKAKAARHVERMRPLLEENLSSRKDWCSRWFPRESNSPSDVIATRKKIVEWMNVEWAESILADLPARNDGAYLVFEGDRLPLIRKASKNYERVQEQASEILALCAIASKHELFGIDNELLYALPEWNILSEVLIRTIPKRELGGLADLKPGQVLTQEQIVAMRKVVFGYEFQCDSQYLFHRFLWRYPTPAPPQESPPAGTAASSPSSKSSTGQTYSVRYEILSPGPVKVEYRNSLGGMDEKRFTRADDGQYVIDVTLSADENAVCSATALDQDAPISVWLYVNGKRVCVSTDNKGGGRVICGGNLNSPEK